MALFAVELSFGLLPRLLEMIASGLRTRDVIFCKYRDEDPVPREDTVLYPTPRFGRLSEGALLSIFCLAANGPSAHRRSRDKTGRAGTRGISPSSLYQTNSHPTYLYQSIRLIAGVGKRRNLSEHLTGRSPKWSAVYNRPCR